MSRGYWLAVTDRAVKTGAQSSVLAFGADQVNAITADWALVAGFGIGGVVLSVLTSLASTGIGQNHGSPSLTTESVYEPQHRA